MNLTPADPPGGAPFEPLPPGGDDASDADAIVAMRARGVQRAKEALRLASASLPHLSGLARLVRVKAVDGVEVAAVSSSGLVVVRPELFATLPLADAAYVMAHELLHLALRTHDRGQGADPLVVNFAHDYIINDMLSESLGRMPPLGGLSWTGARQSSLEELVSRIDSSGQRGSLRCWNRRGKLRGGQRPAPSPISRALHDAGLLPPPEPEPEEFDPGDLLNDEREQQLEPELSDRQRQQCRAAVARAAAKAASLSQLKDKLAASPTTPTTEQAMQEALYAALRGAYNTPWEAALQRWFDAMVPGQRTYARPSRRGADRSDVVLPGRRREGWTLHIVLDTSGSMEHLLSAALGTIAQFCEASLVTDVHIVQCDEHVTVDEWIEVEQLASYPIRGFGYSDMCPAMNRLAEDSEVTSVVVLTDGGISYPAESPPYETLWVIFGSDPTTMHFNYGTVIGVAF
jgi:predicted metal-dependent peptidase